VICAFASLCLSSFDLERFSRSTAIGKEIGIHENLSRVFQEEEGDDRPCRRATTRRTSVSQVGAIRRNRRWGTFGHTRWDIIALNIDRRLSATASRALEIKRKMPESIRASLFLSLSISLFPWPLRRFACTAIGVSTHTHCAHNRLCEAKPL